MAEIALRVFGFPDLKPYGIVLRDPVSRRHCWLKLWPEYFYILRAMFADPGDPLLSHEVACRMLDAGGVSVTRIRAALAADRESLTFFIHYGRTGFPEAEITVFTFDACGYSIAARVPIVMSEEDFAVCAEAAPTLAELGMTAPRGPFGDN